jgi:hypothetical protein
MHTECDLKHRRHPPILKPLTLALALAAAMASLQPAMAANPPAPGSYWNAVEIAPANGFGNQLVPHALNDAGWVVGSFNDAGGDRGFIWSGGSGQVPQRLPLSDAWGIRPDGTVLGAALGSSLRREGFTSLTGREYAVQVAPNGAITVLTPTNLTTNNAGQTFGMAFAANAAGTVVGVSTDAAGQYGAAIWSNGSGPSFIDISTGSRPGGFLGGRSSLAINDAGTVVGGTHQLQTWSAALGRTDLGGLATAISTSGADINNAGRIVGTSSFSDGLSKGFVYRPDTAGFTVLSGLGGQGTGSSAAWALNERGDVVGLSGVVGLVDSRATWWKPGGEVVDLNGLNFTNLSGVRLQTAIDINNRGQILVSGMRVDGEGQITDTGLRHWVLSLCERCGQIAPYPNPAGTTLDVGADWYDAHNAIAFENVGTLQLGTLLVNRSGASITNRGEVGISARGSWSNDGHLFNKVSGRLSIGGDFSNFEGGIVSNSGVVQVLQGATVALWNPGPNGGWLNDAGSTFVQRGGALFNGGNFMSVRAVFEQQAPGVFSNNGEFVLFSSAAAFGGHFWSQGTVLFGADVIESPSLHSQVEVTGRFTNADTGHVTLSDGSKLYVGNGYFESSGRLTLTGSATKFEVGTAAALRLMPGPNAVTSVKDGALLDVRGPVSLLQLDAGATIQVNHLGSLFVRQQAYGELSGTVESDGVFSVSSGADLWVSGRISNNGLLQVRGADTQLRVLPSTLGDAANPVVLENLDRGVIEISEGALLRVEGVVTTKGQMTVSDGGRTLVDGGTFVVIGSVTGNGSFEQASGQTRVFGLLEQSSLTFRGGAVMGFGIIRGNTVFEGATVDADLRIQPGNSPGTLTIDGDARIDGATYELELGERAQDRLIVTGNLALGRLTVALKSDGGYLPDLDESFSFIRAASVTELASGSQVTLDTAALGSGWVQTLRLGATGLRTTLDRLDTEELADVPVGGITRVDAGTWRYSRRLNIDGLLEVAGQLTHRVAALDLDTGAVLEAGQLVVNGGAALSVLEGGVFSNRSELQSFGQILNTGLLYNRAGGTIDSQFQIRNDGVLRNDGLIRLNVGTAHNTGRWEERGRLEVGTGAVVENTGQVELQGTLVNQGLVINAGQVRVLAGGTLTGAQDASVAPASSGNYRQVGATSALTRVDGVLAQSRIDIIDGTLEGTGRVVGAINLGSTTLRPGGTGEVGQLTLEGAVSLSNTQIELAVGPDGASRLNVQGSLDIGLGTRLYLLFQPGDLPAPGTHLDLLSVEGSLGGASLLDTYAIQVDMLGSFYLWEPPPGQVASFRWHGQQLVFDVSAVPEPGTWALLLGGLALLVARSRRPAARPA